VKLSEPLIIHSEFPVFVFSNPLESESFERLRREFPLSHRAAGDREFFTEAHSSSEDARLYSLIAESPAWSAFVAELLDKPFKRTLMAFLYSSRREWSSTFDYLRLLSRTLMTKTFVTVSLHTGIRGYGLSPHTDKADKFAALILYFGGENESAESSGGTTFFRPKSVRESRKYLRRRTGLDKGIWSCFPFKLLPLTSAILPRTYSGADRQANFEHREIKEFHDLHEPFFTSRFTPNTLALFFKDQLTWHEVDLSDFPAGVERRTLLINVYCSPTHLVRLIHKLRQLVTRLKTNGVRFDA
jgi:hypothetical protein